MAARRIGSYLIHREIGAGGMAAVHLGRLVGAGGFTRPVAIKRLHRHLARDAELRAMFLDEARIAARITHPNVVSTLDFVSHGEELLLVMELVQGVSLVQILATCTQRGERIPVPVACAIAVGVLRGLGAAHEATDDAGAPLGLVHRDVSPHNVLIDVEGVAKVVDFGIARARGRARETGQGELKGKLGYMPPEQLRGDPVDARVDVYATAIVLWEMLAGRTLYRGEAASILYDVLERAPEAPSTITPGLSPALDAVVLRGLAKDREARFTSAAEMEEALARCATIASPREVARWLRDTQAEQLARQSTWIAELEQTDPSTSLPQPTTEARRMPAAAGSAAGGTEILPAAARVAQGGGTTPMARAAIPPRRTRRAIFVAGAALLVGAIGAIGWGLWRGGARDDDAVSAGPVDAGLSDATTRATSAVPVVSSATCGGPGAPCCDGGCAAEHLVCRRGRCTGCTTAIYGGDAATATCAKRVDGKVYCWGANQDLLFGIKTHRRAATPFLLEGIHDPALLAFSRTVALATVDGKLVGWGEPIEGVLGDVPDDTRIEPAAAVDLGLRDVIGIGIHGDGAGAGSACAIAAGKVHCWGMNSGGISGEWSYETALRTYPPSHVVPLFEGEHATRLALGRDGAPCVETERGTTCWRRPSLQSPVPTPNEPEDGVFPGVYVARIPGVPFVGGTVGCLLRDGKPSCWGFNMRCEIGKEHVGRRSTPRSPFVEPMRHIVNMSLGDGHLCAIDANLDLYCWGANKWGQVGVDPTSEEDEICKPNRIVLPAPTVDVVAADGHTCALDTLGIVSCFGTDEAGQLGTGTRDPALHRATPRPALVPCADLAEPTP